MACVFVFVLLLYSMATGVRAANGQAFVGLDGNGTNLVLNPPASGQVVVDGYVFQELVQRVGQLEADRDVQRQRLDQLERVCPVIADTTTITGLGPGPKWSAGILSTNGLLYGVPHDSSSVLIINPDFDLADTTTLTDLPTAARKWSDGALASNGKIYCVPIDADY